MWPFSPSRRSLERQVGRILLSDMEARASLEDPKIPLSSAKAYSLIFGGSWESATGVNVTPERALGVPAVWAAVNFISSTFAALPAPVYRKTEGGRERDERHPVAVLLSSYVNDDYLTSFAWRKHAMIQTLLRGRSFTFIEGKKTGRITNFWPMDPTRTTVERDSRGRRRYKYRKPNDEEVVYDVDEIIDVQFMMGADNLGTIDPIGTLKNAIGLAIALEDYACKFFVNGGVPPLSMQMPAGTSKPAMQRATADIAQAVASAYSEKRLVLPMPEGHRLEQIGFNPQHGQLVEARKHQLLEIARIYNLPPVFLQDLEHGTFSNTEQQDLMLVKHTLTQWVECWEQEINAKVWGQRSKNYVEFSLEGLLRGDYATRMAGHATSIQNSIRTPDEVRDLENLPRKGGAAEKLFIQGATVPIDSQQMPPPNSQVTE